MKFKSFNFFLLIFISIFSFSLGAILFQNEEIPITKQNIESTENLIGLNFTGSERDSMISSLTGLRNNYKEIRKVKIDNSIPPAILFNPIPVGMKFNTEEKPFKSNDYSNTKMPENFTDLAYYSIGQLAHLLKTKQITSVQLTKFFIERLKKYDPVLHCVVTLTEELALKQAKKADEEIVQGKYKGLLHGIPFGVKDLLSTENYKTTWGAFPFKDQLINKNSTVVQRLEDAGAILIAKLSMGALAMDDVWFGGRTRNPWDTANGSSGSSAGSASAVSAGLIPFAIGTETWGSIVSPSTICGVSGLRPTYGRVSRFGAMALSWSMDKIGPICRNVEDCAIVFNEIYGPDGKDQTLYDFPFNYNPKINFKNLKIGYLKNDFEKNYDFKIKDSLTLNKLREMGAKLIPIELPDLPVTDISIILDSEAGAAFDELTRSNMDDFLVMQTKNSWPNIFRTSHFIPAVEYINANRIRYLLIQKMAKLFEDIDFYMAPSFEGDNSLLTNLTGHPMVVVPNGFSKDGTPTSITFTGKLFDEALILAAVKAYQDATGFQLKHPKIFSN